MTVSVPEGWEAHGADEAFVEHDLITVTSGSGSPDDPMYMATFSDNTLGVDAATSLEVLRDQYDSADGTESITGLDPITIHGVDFGGFEVVQRGPTLTLRTQFWDADLSDDSVLQIYLGRSAGDADLPQELIDIRDSLTFAPVD